MVEPSNAEQAAWPDATRDYVADLLQRIADLESGRAIVRAEILIDPTQAVTFTARAERAEESSEQPARPDLALGALQVALGTTTDPEVKPWLQTAVDFLTGEYEPLEAE